MQSGETPVGSRAASNPTSSTRAWLFGVPYERDVRYYCEDLVLLIEGCLFRVPRALFKDAELFKDMFSLPVPDGRVVDGVSDEQPLRLPDTYTKDEFRRFLNVVLPLCYRPEKDITWQDWASVLNLSTIWGLDDLRKTSISKLSQFKLDPVDKIILAKRHSVEQWLVPTLNELAQRPKPLSIGHVREQIPVPREVDGCRKCPNCRNLRAWCVACDGRIMSGAATPRATLDFSSAIRNVFSIRS